jgi:4-amino-4-deoxy-L-arabinose transferase-like glycosyltransferase
MPWAIFWVGFGLRVLVILVGHQYKIRMDQANFNFGFEAGRIARSLVTGHGYANPFNGESGPTAWLPPLYPLLLAAVFKVFGVYTRASGFVILTLNSLFSAAVIPGVYEMAARVFDEKGIARRRSRDVAPVALWSAWVWAVYPAALQYAIHWVWEMSLTAVLFTWVIVAALRLREREEAGLWAGFGLLWGLIALSNASLLLCFPAMVIWIVWNDLRVRRWARLKREVLGALLACVVFALVMTPWVVRNERALHAFVPTRGNLGIELYNSSLPMNDGFPWGTAMPLWPGDPVFQLYERMGEAKFAAMRQRQAVANLRAEPGLLAKWTVQRFFFFWEGTPHPADKHPAMEYLRQLSYCFISVCGLLGMALMLWRRVEGAGLFALIFVLLPLPYYLVTVQPRFRHPMEPLIAVLAVYLFRSAEKTVVSG